MANSINRMASHDGQNHIIKVNRVSRNSRHLVARINVRCFYTNDYIINLRVLLPITSVIVCLNSGRHRLV